MCIQLYSPITLYFDPVKSIELWYSATQRMRRPGDELYVRGFASGEV